jgi:flagellar basal-body rod protein FlgC
MDFFSAMDVSSSGMTAERTRINLISSNLANANSTRTAEGGPYRRKDAVFAAVPGANSFDSALARAEARGVRRVSVTEIRQDDSPPQTRYDPGHPDADESGMVSLPNVNVMEEMADMIIATRSYEANVTAANAAKSMALKTLELLR